MIRFGWNADSSAPEFFALIGLWVAAGLIQPLPFRQRAVSMLRRGWARFKLISRAIGNFQSRVLLTLFYFLILAPFGLGVRWFRDPLRLKLRQCSHWLHHVPERRADWESARRQF